MNRLLMPLIGLLLVTMYLGGCALVNLYGAMAGAAETQKLIEVRSQYTDLQDKRVAVVVDAELGMLYDFPELVGRITSGVTASIGRNVPGAKMMHPDGIVAWQWRTPQWNAMPYGDLAANLDVDRVVYIEIYEYRLNPPGNRWLWEGVCAANVSIIERDGFDPDMFADTFPVTGSFPSIKGVDRQAATEQQIATGVLVEFVRKTGWLFYDHEEPKYPDKYRPEKELS